MRPKKSQKSFYITAGVILYLFVLYFTCHYSVCQLELNSVLIFDVLPAAITHMETTPFAIFPLNFKSMFVMTFIYLVAVAAVWVDYQVKRTDAQGVESGSAKWFDDWKNFAKKYVDPKDETNMIFSNEVKLNMNTRKTRKNNNVLVIGGSGTGKSRFMVKPNLLQANCSYVVTDPSGELLQTQAYHLEAIQGYKIKVFDLTDMSKSSHYNPFNYIRDEKGVLLMVNCLIKNTNGDKKGGDPFWEKSETALLLACCFYLIETLPKEEQNFSNVMMLLNAAEIDEDDPDAKSELDILMDNLEKEKPESMAVKNYKIFKMAAGKTAKSILVSAGVRLQVFNFAEVKQLTNDDTLDLASLGDEKQALFVVIPAADSTFNFLVSMMYSQLFETLYYHAEHECKGKRLKSHVRFLLDEFANIGTIPEFDKKLSTMRKYEISCTIILQSLSQLKAMYKDEWEVLVDNCDSFLFLGCQGKTTLEYVNQKLGKATIRSKDSSRSFGSKGSRSESRKHEGRELMTVTEISGMPDNNCILFIRGMNPFYCTKFSLEKHKNYEYSADADEAFEYEYDPYKDMEKPTTSKNAEILDNALECKDVNADRIAREQQTAETIKSGKKQFSKNGLILNEFVPMADNMAELLKSTHPIELIVEEGYDRNYEFKTTRLFMLDLDSLDLEAEEESETKYVGEEPEVFEEPTDFDEPSDLESVENFNFPDVNYPTEF